MVRQKQFRIMVILVLSILLICGCQDSNTVSKAEYDKVVEERDYYPFRHISHFVYQISIGNQ